ncbi:hypothetical protein BJ322DRAFT_1152374 [Thelephora terrestris]|uniref:Zn(2)-C6 fungal-type domain-containing protein n=1 Tax=Thelephora terrestris TaxID=56493 RepID=A0A9P6HQR4_9AGAM|nr:hypothetical protein BJ322DRAFT_1152374 [Thelephora terrestris]
MSVIRTARSVRGLVICDGPTGKSSRKVKFSEEETTGTLPRGRACMQCRRKKKKCDGGLPSCRKCRESREVVECTYREPETVKPESPAELPLVPAATPLEVPPVVSKPYQFSTDAIFDPFNWTPVSWAIRELFGPSNYSLSGISPEDMNLRFRLVFLSYRLAQGIYLSFAQQQAIILGDTSGSFIHPFFIKFAHLVGCHFHRRYCPDDSLIQLETSYLFSVLRTLSLMKEEADPVSYVHAHWLIAMACVTTGNSPKAVRFMKEAADSVERNHDLFLSRLPGLSSVPTTVTVDYSEDLHERLGLLAHILWFRTYMSIYLVDSGVFPMPDDVPGKIPQSILEKFEDILYGPHGGLLSGLTHLFQNYLPVACPVLFEVCPLMVRVRTMLLIRKSRKLIAQYSSERNPTLAWLTQCSEVCTELGERVQLLAKLITKFAAANDHDSCVSLRMCSLVSLSNLGELYHILSHHPLWKLPRVSLKQCEQTMYRLSDISTELMNGNDMRHLPPYAGCSLVRAAIVLRQEIGMMAFEGYIPHPEKSVDEMRKCIGATIDFMTATSNKFYSASSLKNPSESWSDLMGTD